MAKPKNVAYNLKERLQKVYEAGITIPSGGHTNDGVTLPTIQERIQAMLSILKSSPIKATTMNYLNMYDIENNKVRTRISTYLEKKGCIRIQKSIFLVNSESKQYQEIYQTLLDVNSYYENKDSIILVPFNTSDLRSMRIIGKEIHIETLTEKPNTLFF